MSEDTPILMSAHDVRRLRVCDRCGALAFKETFIVGQDILLCARCAISKAGGLKKFMAAYPRTEWEKVPLNVVGVKGMQRLLAALEGEAGR